MEALGLNLADWFILIVLVASGIISFARGFTKEFLSLFLLINKNKDENKTKIFIHNNKLPS